MPKRKRPNNDNAGASTTRPAPFADSQARNTTPHMPERRTISYASDSDTAPPPAPVPQATSVPARDSQNGEETAEATPAGPYSFTAERRRDNARSNTRPRTDPAFGQMSAFPELDLDGEEDYNGPVDDGLGYLRMVRSEARGLARVVTAPKDGATEHMTQGQGPAGQLEDDTDESDLAGYYSDGAYVGRGPRPQDGDTTPVAAAASARDLYYDSLCERFDNHSTRMRARPAAEAIAALDEHHPISCPARSHLAMREWKYLLRETNPHPVQLASMDADTVLRLLGILEGSLQMHLKAGENLSERLSTWVWGLLGRLELAELRTEQVGAVRDLANTAIWAQYRYLTIAQGEAERQRPTTKTEVKSNGAAKAIGLDDYNDFHVGEEEEALTAAKARLLGGLYDEVNDNDGDEPQDDAEQSASGLAAVLQRHQAGQKRNPMNLESVGSRSKDPEDSGKPAPQWDIPSANTLATLDAIITIVGEFFGQRDLLESRVQ